MNQLAFDFEHATKHAASCCNGDCLHHVLMPNMAWACGGSITTKGGHIEFLSGWQNVTCPDCLTEGIGSIRRRSRWQQGRCVECGGPLSKKRVCVDCGVAE